MEKLTRRDFIKTSGLVAGAAAGILSANEALAIDILPDEFTSTKVVIKNEQVPMLLINGEPWTVMNSMTMDYLTFGDNKIANIRDNGLHLYWLNFNNGWGWKDEGTYDFSIIDNNCLKLLEIDPDAYIVLNLPLDSVYNNTEMKSWNKKYPEELVRNEDGSTQIHAYSDSTIVECPSMASKIWLNEAKRSLSDIIRHIKTTSYGKRIIGYVPLSGVTYEWMYWGSQNEEFVDYSKPFRSAFQFWLKTKYILIDNLNQAYKTNFNNYGEIPLPSRIEREKDDYFTFLDPKKSQYLIDFRQFFSEIVADDILELARVVKEETEGNALCGTYYGYVMYILWPQWMETGHFALGKVLKSNYIDFLMSPASYNDRGIGGGSGFMTAVDSFKLHNKYYIDQADIRTYNSPSDQEGFGRVHTLQDSIAVLEREFANTLVSGAACQWFDFGAGWIHKDTVLMDVVGKLRNIEKNMQNVFRKTMDKKTSIAVIVDDKSTYYTIQNSPFYLLLIYNQYPALSRTGAGFDCFLLEDLQELPEYNCYLFLNTFNITNTQKQFIDTYLKTNNKTLIWIFAPGIIDGNSINSKRVEEITGIKMNVEETYVNSSINIISNNDPITSFIPDGFSYSGEIGPLFIPTEGKVLGNLGNGKGPGLVVKRFSNWTSVYSLFPNLPSVLLRGIAKYAGVHIANTNDEDITYLSDKLLAIHTLNGGKRTLYVPENYQGMVKELVTNNEFTVINNSFEVELQPSSTSIFLMETIKRAIGIISA